MIIVFFYSLGFMPRLSNSVEEFADYLNSAVRKFHYHFVVFFHRLLIVLITGTRVLASLLSKGLLDEASSL